MLRVVYLLSCTFDYSKLICGDAGPQFAADYGWPTATIQTLDLSEVDVVVVDPRFPESELGSLRRIINGTRVAFALRVTDPIWENCRDHWWYKFVDHLLDEPRIHIILAYQAAEITALFGSRCRRTQFIYAPYVYRTENERVISHESRKHAILFSGASNAKMYPVRAAMNAAARWWPPLRLMSTTLPHPGYPDVGHQQSHSMIAERYVDLMAKFKFAGVCSSRCRLEFLKYRELAYAGVVPVGDMPATLLDCPPDFWIPWRRNVVAFAERLRTVGDVEERAAGFRRFMRQRRDAEAMKKVVTQRLERIACSMR